MAWSIVYSLKIEKPKDEKQNKTEQTKIKSQK